MLVDEELLFVALRRPYRFAERDISTSTVLGWYSADRLDGP